MPQANLLFSNTFPGAGYPDFDPWPSFSRPTGNPSLASVPVVDGYGNGIASRHHAALWRLKETRNPGRANYKADLWGKWKNAGFAGQRELGLIVRFKDYSNFIVARLRSMATASPELRLYKVVNGTETQLGSTYTGSPISATALNARAGFRVRVEDLADGTGDTKVSVFTEPEGADADGDERITYTGDLHQFRGAYTVGVELGSLVKLDDIRVTDLEVYDFADEWVPSAPAADPGTGWQVELDGQLYDIGVDGTFALGAQSPPVVFKGCGQSFGLSGGSEAKFGVLGQFQAGMLRPGQPVRCWHDGDIRFAGHMVRGSRSAAPGETQEWTAKAGIWGAVNVLIEDDDCVPSIIFNVSDPESEDYDPDRSGKTIGQVIEWLFDRYTDGDEGLRFFGAAPATGYAYASGELTALDAVIPDVSVSGNFLGAVQSLLRFMMAYQINWDPATKVWHFVDITSLSGQDIALTNEHATLSIDADPEQSYTAVLWRGTKKEDADDVALTLTDRAWSDAQENAYEKNKRHRSHVTLDVLAAGDAPFPAEPGQPPTALVYVDVASGVLDEDDFRGAIASVTGDAYNRWVISNTSTRIWMGSPLWGGGTPPVPPQTITLNLVHPSAIPALSAAGVGRAFFLPPAVLCPTGGKGASLKNNGFCGNATVTGTGTDGASYTQEYAYKVHFMSQEQTNGGMGCAPVVELAEKPKPPIGLVNYLPPAGGSPPVPDCESGSSNPDMPQVSVNINLSATEDCAPKLRVPEEGWHGPAYAEDDSLWDGGGEPAADDWGVRRTLVINFPDFTSVDDHTDGLTKASNAILSLASQKVYRWQVTLATPWEAFAFAGPRPRSVTSTWAGLDKRITLSSTKRTTGFESTTDLPVFSVWWDVPGNKTVLQAGTAAGWIGGDFGAIAKAVTAKDFALIAAKQIKALEDFRNRLLSKSPSKVFGQQAGPVDGCDVQVIDRNTKKITNINLKAEQEQEVMNHQGLASLALDTLFNGVEQDHPGAAIEVPGLDEYPAQQVVDGPVLRSYADHRVPFMGPTDGTNANRGKYGGLIGVDDADAGGSPTLLFKRGGFAFRKQPNTDGDQGGGVGIQFSALDSDGNPGSWTNYSSPLDLPDGVAPLGMLGAGSTQHQLLQRSRELARALGRVENEVGKLLAPGDTDTGAGIDETPADLASMLRAPGVLGDLRVVPESFGDAGGIVLEGPISESGATAELYWRVMTPEMILARVENVGMGSGTNGGAWSYALTGDAYEYMSSGRIVHKQAHPIEFEPLCGMSAQPSPTTGHDSSHPFGITGNTLALDTAADSGVAVNIPIPNGARGVPAFHVMVKEDWNSPLALNDVYDFDFTYSYQASAWTSAPSATTHAGAVTGDGSGSGTGQFTQPGGSVPPGLRAVSGAVISPGTGSGGFGGIVGGIGVDIAVVEGGYLIRGTEDGPAVADAMTTNQPWAGETAAAADTYSLDVEKVIAEAVAAADDFTIELNPPVAEQELCACADGVVLELNP